MITQNQADRSKRSIGQDKARVPIEGTVSSKNAGAADRPEL
jgi:hypothetical protein